MGTDIENVAPVPGSAQNEARPKSESPPPAKKKKKKKTTTTSNSANGRASIDPLDESRPLPNEEAIRGDGVHEWRARATNRRALLAEAKAENSVLNADLAAALARVNDAELAEAVVNKGLVKARSVIAQRDVALGELKTEANNLKADNVKLMEDKKRLEKRLLILKTVSANLQEAREARDLAEKKLQDANGANAELRADVEALKRQIEALNMIKQQLSRAELDVDELSQANEELQRKAKRDSVRAAGIGAASVMALSVTIRILAGGKK